jgi:hypothetical protein
MNDNFDPDLMYQKILTAGLEWADLKAAYEALDDCTKSVLANIKLDHPDHSNAQAETHALASGAFRGHLVLKEEARHKYLRAEVQYKALVALAEWRRSQEATRRAEARIL